MTKLTVNFDEEEEDVAKDYEYGDNPCIPNEKECRGVINRTVEGGYRTEMRVGGKVVGTVEEGGGVMTTSRGCYNYALV